jgi:D-alanyl-D-alanine carboxypeptidase
MKTTALLSLCILVMSCDNNVETKPIPEVIEQKVDLAKFQAILDSIYMSNPESIGVMVHIESQQHGISWSGSSGYSDKINKTKLLPQQPVLIASSIKTYISASALRLQEEKLLSIEDPISKHLTEKTVDLFETDGYDFDQIKIKHLLSHTSGIEDYVTDDYIERIDENPTYRWTRDEQMQLATEVGDPLGKPQEFFQYADVNFLLVTEIIEEVTKKPFYTAMRALLKYDQLDLTSTWFPTLENTPGNTAEMAHQYWNEKAYGENKIDISWDSHDHDISWDLYGGGGIATTAKELAQFSYNLFNGNIIENEAILKLLSTPVTPLVDEPNNYRLGLSEASIQGLTGYGHGGFWGTIVFYIPRLDVSISVVVLERHGKQKVIKGMLNTIVTELAGQLYPLEDLIVAEE